MSDFLDNVQAKADAEKQVDPSALAWAARAMSVITVMGHRADELTKEQMVEHLESLLAKAPTEVVVNGTLMLVGAMTEGLK